MQSASQSYAVLKRKPRLATAVVQLGRARVQEACPNVHADLPPPVPTAYAEEPIIDLDHPVEEAEADPTAQ